MQIQIKATKLELTDAIRDYIQKKCDMLEKYLGDRPVINCHFEVGLAVGGQHSGEIYRAEINLDIPGKLLRVEKTEADLYKAIDKVKDHMEREIVKYKEKNREN
jgi:putative sigma-54 modulation protein